MEGSATLLGSQSGVPQDRPTRSDFTRTMEAAALLDGCPQLRLELGVHHVGHGCAAHARVLDVQHLHTGTPMMLKPFRVLGTPVQLSQGLEVLSSESRVTYKDEAHLTVAGSVAPHRNVADLAHRHRQLVRHLRHSMHARDA